MLLLTRAVLATPIVAAALAALLSSNGIAAHIIPLRPRMSNLHSRQIAIPAACAPACDTLITSIENCTTAACACTAQNMDEAAACLDCIGDVQDGQVVIDELAMDCEDYGITLSVPTITASGTPMSGGATATLTLTALPSGM